MKLLYVNLLESGWAMVQIDEMDLLGYIRLVAWKARKKQEPRLTTIDQLWPWMNAAGYQITN